MSLDQVFKVALLAELMTFQTHYITLMTSMLARKNLNHNTEPRQEIQKILKMDKTHHRQREKMRRKNYFSMTKDNFQDSTTK